MDRHLLIIAYAFPPSSVVGAMRPLRVAKSLAAAGGWKVTVISADRPARRHDPELLAEIPAATTVLRAPVCEPLTWLERPGKVPASTPRPAAAVATQAPAAPPAGGPRAWLRDALSTPDGEIFWPWPVLARALRVHLDRPLDAVMVTSPPWSAQYAGLALSRLLRIPWIADYRDPWTDIDRRHRTRAFERWNRRLEEFALPGAAAVVSTSDTYTEILRERFPGRPPATFQTIYNGFDETKIVAGPRAGRRRLTLVHLGTLYEIWRPWASFAALGAWLARHPERRRDVVLRFVGQPGRRTLAALGEHGLNDVLEVTGFVGHEEAIEHCLTADALLLALGSGPGVPRGWLPSKLFEYIAYERPILANVAVGEARRLILDAGAGWTAADDEAGVLEAALDELWARKQAATDGHVAWRNDPEQVARLTQGRLVERWLGVLAQSQRDGGRS